VRQLLQQQQQQEPLRGNNVTKTSCEAHPRLKRAKTPRNAMVLSRRSIRARGLNEKYNVDWKTVLGEGAYGSVHPARLATTGEKVCYFVGFFCIYFDNVGLFAYRALFLSLLHHRTNKPIVPNKLTRSH